MSTQPSQHTFRLRLVGHGADGSKVFNCLRNAFRHALADALIDLRLRDPGSPLVLEIAFSAKDGTRWLAPVGREGEVVAMPAADMIRWECIGDLYDDRVKHYWTEVAKNLPVKRQSPRETAETF